MGPIGVFDSGYGGLTILKEIVRILPQYDYVYLGDNGRAPYGNRSYETVYHYTWQCVHWLIQKGCSLVIIACNTASAKALRTIQQKNLPFIKQKNVRVLGVIRPTAEVLGGYSKSGVVGILGTSGTVLSGSYQMEIAKFFPDLRLFLKACPMWVPLIENNEIGQAGCDFFVRRDLSDLISKSKDLDTILLGCTHYPLLQRTIQELVPEHLRIVSQGPIVAASLKDYLFRHPEMEQKCSRNASLRFYTTESGSGFNEKAGLFFERPVFADFLDIEMESYPFS